MVSEKERRQKMRARKLRDLGRPQRVLPHEFAEVCRIVDAAHQAGMGYHQMADQVGLDRVTVRDIGERDVETVHRTTYEKLLGLRVEVDLSRGRTRHAAAKVDPTGTLRRLRALTRLGFASEVIASHLDMWPSALRALINGEPGFVYATTADDVRQVYDKLKDVAPEDFGTRGQHIRGNRKKAAALHWAPPSCWDDNIDDPDAYPEWTGACGTEEGYRIHVRETVFEGNNLPLCQACRDAVETVTYVEKVVFRYERFVELYKQSGLTPKQFTRRVFGVTDHKTLSRKVDTTYRWRDGSRTPRTRGLVQAIAGALECSLGDLVDLDAIERGVPVPAVRDGEFNQHVFRAAIDMSGLSYSEVARLPGSQITQATVGKWLRGDYKPSDPGKVKPIADHFGVDVEVFYQ